MAEVLAVEAIKEEEIEISNPDLHNNNNNEEGDNVPRTMSAGKNASSHGSKQLIDGEESNGEAASTDATAKDAENPPDSQKEKESESPSNDNNRQVDDDSLPTSNSIEEYYKMVQNLLHVDPQTMPPSYVGNSEKEEHIIEFVENFLRQYKQLFPNRKELFILPQNEWEVKKFVCTTVRPTLLKFKELYDYKDCARFVADYLSYEYLDPPYDIPKQLPSPTFTLNVQGGNSFDYSVLLCSLLRGAGYDAYVVSGYASKDVTLMDDSRLFTNIKNDASPFILGTLADEIYNDAEIDSASAAAKVNQKQAAAPAIKYKLKSTRVLKSAFLQRQEEKKINERKQQEDERLMKIEMEKRKQRELKEQDDLKGLRVHAWILILPGKREISEAIFIEPSTGKVYPTDDHHFLGVESVFNNYNYWVNMQVCYDGLKGISFDLGDNARWEFVFLENSQPGILSNENNDAGDGDGEEEEEEEESSGVADLPPSWVSNLVLTQEQFEKRCPTGRKVTLYQNCITETFAEYQRKDGMVYRVSLFSDDERTNKTEVQEYFSRRQDKLVRRIRYLQKGEIHELFERGRPHALRQQIIVQSKMKEMHFYSNARVDGLVRREELPRKSMEFFTGRDDGLVYRSSTYENVENQDSYGTIVKMTEKYANNPDVPLNENIDKITFFLKDEKIRVIFHLPESRIIPSVQEFRKPGNDQKSNLSDLIMHFDPDPFAQPLKKQYLYAKMVYYMKKEQGCLISVKAAEKEVQEIIQSRNNEEKDVQLVVSVYDTIRNSETEQLTLGMDNQTKRTNEEGEGTSSSKADYLSPFLVNYNEDTSRLSREDAIAIKDACLKSQKERLIEKANIIQKRLDEETGALQKAQQAYQKDQDTLSLEETESYMQFCQEAMFRIQILEKRLAKHKEQAPEKYVSLDRKLRSDPRLANLLQ